MLLDIYVFIIPETRMIFDIYVFIFPETRMLLDICVWLLLGMMFVLLNISYSYWGL
jgi:hypothetical protein